MLLLTVVHRESLHKKRSEARASAATKGMEDEESLEPGALVRQLPHPVQHQVDDLLADGVVTPRVVVGGVLLAGHQLLGVEQLAVRSSSDFVDHRWLEVNEDSPRDVLASPWKISSNAWNILGKPTSLREEGVEGVVSTTDSLIGGHLPIGLDSMFEAVELPAGVAHLATRLAHVHADTLTLRGKLSKRNKMGQSTSIALTMVVEF